MRNIILFDSYSKNKGTSWVTVHTSLKHTSISSSHVTLFLFPSLFSLLFLLKTHTIMAQYLLAQWDYTAEGDYELSFKEGDKIKLLEKHNNDW